MATDFGEVGSAHVVIKPQLDSGFTSKVARDVDQALRSTDAGAARLGQSTRLAAENLGRAASQAKATADGLSSAASSGRSFRSVADDLGRAATNASRTRSELGSARLSPEAQRIAQQLDQALDGVGQSIRSAHQDLDTFERKAKQAGESGEVAFGRLTRSVAGLVAAYAGLNFFRRATDLASDLGESTSKAENVFKSAVGTVKTFAKTSSDAFGISQRSALEMGSTFGNLLTSMGLTRQAASGMSVEMLKLAADLASFNNIGIQEALDKLRAGLVGEYEPLRSLGVTLNADAVAAKALELGLTDSTKSVSAAAKIQATYALIVEQSSNAVGDFARTSDGLANTQRRLSAAWEDAQVAIGEKLLPSALEIAAALTELIPVAVDLGTAVADVLGHGIDGVLPTVKLFAFGLQSIAPLLEAIPAPLIQVVANFLLLQKALSKLGFDDLLTRPFKKAMESLLDAAESGLSTLGQKFRTRLATDISSQAISGAFTSAGAAAARAASDVGTQTGSAFAMGVKSTSTAVELWNPQSAQLAVQQAGQVGKAAGQAATGAGTFAASIGGLSQFALPALGVALAAGTAALGIWQQRRAEAAAAQQKYTAAMVADTEAAIRNGQSIESALTSSTDTVLKQALDEFADKRRLDDLNKLSAELENGATGLNAYGEAIRSVGASGDASTAAVRRFRKALLDSGQLELKFSKEATVEDIKRVEDAFLRTGKVVTKFSDNFDVRLVGNQGLLNQFNDNIDATAKGFEQAKAAAELLADTQFGRAAGALDPLKKEVGNTKDAFKDAEKAVDDFLDAVRSIGDTQVQLRRAEEGRQLAVQEALDSVAPQEDVTPEDVAAQQEKAAAATIKRAAAEDKLNAALAEGNQEEINKADAALRTAKATEIKAQQKLEDLQAGLAETPLSAQAILSGMDREAVDIRNGFGNIIDETLNQATLIAKEQGADTAAAFWDTAIRDTRNTLGPEYQQVLDTLLAERNLNRSGGEILLGVALDQDGISDIAKQLLTPEQKLQKILELTIAAGGDVPDELEPLLSEGTVAQRKQFVLDVIAELPADGQLDPALLKGLDTTAQRDLILSVSAAGDVDKLPFDPENIDTLLSDKEFTKSLLINIAAAGGQLDSGSELGLAVQAAVKGTPLELFMDPQLEGFPEAKKQVEELTAAAKEQMRLEGEIVKPEFHGTLASIQTDFDHVKTKIDDAKTSLDNYLSTETPDKHVRIMVFGLPVIKAAWEGIQAVADQPDQQRKTVTIDVFGQAALDAAVRALEAAARYGGTQVNATISQQPPPTAIGGIFQTAQNRLIAEAGAELVLPLSAAQHSRAAYLLEQAGVFDRFAAEFAARVAGVGTAAFQAASGGGSRTVNMQVYTNDPDLMARRVSQELAREVF